MKRLHIFSLVVIMLLSIGLVMAPGSAVFAAEGDISDPDISEAVGTELLVSENIPSHLIDISVREGVVVMSGSVDTLFAKNQAEEEAMAIKGVRSVVNDIKVKDIHVSDPTLRSDVINALLEDPATESYEINVSADNGVVTLSGTVDSWTEKQLAEEVASQVKGVKAIVNNVEIDYDEARSDIDIRNDIKRKLENDPYIDSALIEVDVENDEVELSGSVGSSAEKNLAVTNAWVEGVKSVDASGLKVEWWLRDEMERKSKYQTKSDSKIKQAVKDGLLYDPRTFSFMVNVEVDNGVVTLNGEVDNLKAKNAAEQVAENTIGVWEVNNLIKVRMEEEPADSEIEENVTEAFDRDAILNDEYLTVNVINQKVFLSGTVDSEYEKVHAGSVASGVYGTVTVQNNIEVEKEWPWKSDSEIEEDVNDELFWNVFVDSDDISVEVQNGVVTLEGSADTIQEHEEAVESAFEAGAKSVKSELEIENRDGETPGETYMTPYSPY